MHEAMKALPTGSANGALMLGAALSALAALLHVAIIFGGPSWYRFFHAGPRLTAAAAAGRLWPHAVTFGIASVLVLWSAYALSGAGVIVPLPLTRAALYAITTIYLLRGLLPVPAMLLAGRRVTGFWLWSSLVCLIYGAAHLVGVLRM
ncbi:hypothetical protein E4L96_13225 [Massilia arenosa]|uniref:Uncharacterized protein n=1 Tax=Zemynaea arenosa TaxID=2561931 RepID=A0A4Y9S9D8_9BURK|nr:hypothetical protein [Massilia arenosa]TFW18385.1 hypothetical protein E4L96_13225 [Massilia arenosa]